MTKTLMHLIAAASLLTSAGAQAITINIDGNLADWGVARTGKASDWTPTPNKGIQFTIEDQHDSYLNPGYGGQAYDAEAIYAVFGKDAAGVDKLFIALATGHNPNTANNPGRNTYGAGDFAIDFGKDGTYEMGINIKPSWDAFGVARGIYKNPSWALGLWNSSGAHDPSHADPTHPTSMTAGRLLGTANLLFTTTGQTGYGFWAKDSHYFYEMSIGLDMLTAAGWNGTPFDIHWTQNCANDSIIVDPPAPVPEPGTLALLPLGLLGLMALRHRKTA